MNVVLISRDHRLGAILTMALSAPEQLTVLHSPTEVPDSGETEIDAVVLDLPAHDRRPAYDELRQRYEGRVVVPVDNAMDTSGWPPDAKRRFLVRPFQVADLLAGVQESQETSVAERAAKYRRRFRLSRGQVPAFPSLTAVPRPADEPPPPVEPAAAEAEAAVAEDQDQAEEAPEATTDETNQAQATAVEDQAEAAPEDDQAEAVAEEEQPPATEDDHAEATAVDDQAEAAPEGDQTEATVVDDQAEAAAEEDQAEAAAEEEQPQATDEEDEEAVVEATAEDDAETEAVAAGEAEEEGAVAEAEEDDEDEELLAKLEEMVHADDEAEEDEEAGWADLEPGPRSVKDLRMLLSPEHPQARPERTPAEQAVTPLPVQASVAMAAAVALQQRLEVEEIKRSRGRRRRIVANVAAGLVLLLVGVGVGRASAPDQPKRTSPPAAQQPVVQFRNAPPPTACTAAMDNADQVISYLVAKIRDQRLSKAIQAYGANARACRNMGR